MSDIGIRYAKWMQAEEKKKKAATDKKKKAKLKPIGPAKGKAKITPLKKKKK